MADPTKTDSTPAIAWQFGAVPAELVEFQKVVLHHQAELLQTAQQRMTAWTNRRQEALETGIDALKRISDCKTPIEAAAICGEWLSGSMTRVLTDLSDAQSHAFEMAKNIQKSSRAVLETQAEAGQAAVVSSMTAASKTASKASEHLREAAD